LQGPRAGGLLNRNRYDNGPEVAAYLRDENEKGTMSHFTLRRFYWTLKSERKSAGAHSKFGTSS
jgi:hypothetical protein